MKMQGKLVEFTIFVNYAYFYVNIVMLTEQTGCEYSFIILDDNAISSTVVLYLAQNVDFEGWLANSKP